ncbi:MAG: anthranilate synthase component I family protein [Phycisphaerae bacterium]|nr:anthranilate synthase component I family protein [Phycisphaerae bacterium]
MATRADVGIVCRKLQIDLDPLEAMRRLQHRASPLFLDSAAADSRYGRFSVLACEPTGMLWTGRDGKTHVDFGGSKRTLDEGPLAALAPGLRPFRVVEKPEDLPCFVGWGGYFGYETGRFIERLPATTKPDIKLPVARLGFYDAVAVHDHARGEWTLMAADLHHGYPPPYDRVVKGRLDTLAAHLTGKAPKAAKAGKPVAAGKAKWNMSRAKYLEMVRRGIDYIAAGDIFQVNLAQRLSASLSCPAWALYERLRVSNPGWYAAYMAWHEGKAKASDAPTCAVLSSSPELFLEARDRKVITRPIKGTRPRGADEDSDAAMRQELIASEKDRAELNMIIDLERNDLGRVCEYGSVKVTEPRCLEAHPTVWHSVGTVEGTLHERFDVIDLLKATLPGGSITGAPKVRAMEIIDELEPTERSVYCGSIGMIGLDQSAVLNIAIRTIIVDRGTAHVQVGGGIVADSDPELEYAETLHKARGMLEALGLDEAGLLEIGGE